MSILVANNPLRRAGVSEVPRNDWHDSQELDKSSRALRETLLFSYQEGINWTRNLYKQGGWGSRLESLYRIAAID